jgi:hypothetical protein
MDMRMRWGHELLLVLVFGLVALVAVPTPAADAPDAAKINKLIEQMGSDTFEDREKATAALDTIGVPALEALRKASKSTDMEIAHRSEELVRKIEKRLESVNVLKPTMVHLVYKETPVTEAVADFAKKTGYRIGLHDPQSKLKDRKVTLDTGNVTFWEAFDQFCAKAGLVEASPNDLLVPLPPNGGPVPLPPVPVPQPQPIRKLPGRIQPVPPQPMPPQQGFGFEFRAAPEGQAQAQPAQAPVAKPAIAIAEVVLPQAQPAIAPPAPPMGGFGFVGQPAIARPVGNPVFPTQNQITLVDGKHQTTPVDYRSAVRVRTLTEGAQVTDKEYVLPLQISPEPKLQWQNLISLRIDKAIDNNDQKLTQVMNNGNDVVPGNPQLIRPFIKRAPFIPAFPGMAGHQQTVLQLKKGEQASKSLKELTGVITAQVLGVPQPMITVENILKAGGKTIKGTEGGSIKVVEVTKDDNGLVKVKFELEMPPNVVPPNGGIGAVGGFGFGGVAPGGIQILPALPVNPAPPPGILPKPAPNPAPKEFRQGAVLPKGALAAPPVQVQAVPAQAAPLQVQVQQIQVQGNVQIGIAVGPGGFGGPIGGPNGISLVDDKGNTIPPTGYQVEFAQNQGNLTGQSVMTFQVQKGQGQPAKLIFSASKSVTIDIPFTLKDITLPK